MKHYFQSKTCPCYCRLASPYDGLAFVLILAKFNNFYLLVIMEEVYGSGGFQILPRHSWQLIILSRNMAVSRSLPWYTRALLERWITFYHLMMSPLNKMGIRFSRRLESEKLHWRWFMSATFFRVVFKHFSDLFLFVLSPALTPRMINQHTQSAIIPNAPHFPTHDKNVFLFLKNLPPTRYYTRPLGHVANSHEQKLTSTCCLSVKMTDKMFFFSSCLCDNTSSSRLSPVRIEILTWESWNPDIFLTCRAKDRVHYASVNKAWLCPWALRLPDIMKTFWASGRGLGDLSMTWNQEIER